MTQFNPEGKNTPRPPSFASRHRGALGLIVVVVGVAAVGALLSPPVHRGREPAARITSINNLKQIGLACHHYHDAYQYFPTENMPGNMPNRSKLSWRVQILPYLENESLHKEFHHDEPWDSPHNLKLLPRMPKDFVDPRFQRSPSDREKGLTYYRGFVGPGSVLGSNPPASFVLMENVNLMASYTILVVEAGDPVPWTKPEDPNFNENSPFGGPKRINFAAAFMDGHVQMLPADLDREKVRRMIDWRNAEPIELP